MEIALKLEEEQIPIEKMETHHEQAKVKAQIFIQTYFVAMPFFFDSLLAIIKFKPRLS
jgi:hypothetical protein